MKDFRGKVAAITGAGSGIGRALALELARRGAVLALGGIDGEAAEQTAQEVRALGAACSVARLDVSDRDAVFAWAEACRAEHGQVNVVVNNAGVALAALAENVAIADFRWIMGINFWGVVHGTQAFLPHLRASGEGHVVNLSSIFGMVAMPTQGSYNAAKFAVRGYTEALRMELELAGAPVGVTCVHPGGVATGIARAQRIDPAIFPFLGQDRESFLRQSERLIQTTTAQAAARRILAGVQRNARRVLVGPDAAAADLVQRVLGAGYQSLVVRQTRRMRAARG